MRWSLSYEARRRFSSFLARAPNWSTLRTLGQSRLLAFTVFVAFLGCLIVFNNQIVDFLSFSPSLIEKWIGASEFAKDQTSKNFTLVRLQLTYFGLCFLGTASFLFTILCPPEIKRLSNISEYIETETPLITNARTGLLVSDVARSFLSNHGDEEARGPVFLREMAYTGEQVALFDSVFKEITESIDWPDDEPANSPLSSANKDDAPSQDELTVSNPIFEMRLINISGEYLTEKVARVIDNHRRVEKFFWSNFEFAARKSVTDLLALRYLALDHSKPAARLIVLSCYSIGFVILFYPTAWTFVRIIASFAGI